MKAMAKVRIVPLGGTNHVTRNMFVYEYWPDQGEIERIVVDCGIGFPEEEMLGVDLVLPDVSYLQGKEKTLIGAIFTHGHDDHIGAIPYIFPKLFSNLRALPLFASRLTAGLIESTVKDFGLNLNINVTEDNTLYKLGHFSFELVPVTHSVPDTKHVLIYTPIGTFYHGSDFKFDFTPVDGKAADLQKMALAGKKGILCLLSDCLRVEKEGFTPSERLIEETFEKEINNCQGKFIVTTISSNIHRIQQAVNVAARHHRQVVFLGRSIEENLKVAQRLGFFKIPQNVYLKKQKINTIADHKLCLIVAGSQGQEDSALVKIANNIHERVKIKPGDKVIFSVDPIPGNENAFYQTIDKLSKLGAIVSYSDILEDLHVSGHASSGELKIFLSLLKPRYLVPIGGNFRHMNHFKNLSLNLGFNKESTLILRDGQIIAFDETGKVHFEEILDLKTVIVDGLGIGDVGRIVLNDRKKMSEEGIVVVVIPLKRDKKRLLAEPEIISRGFVFMRMAKDLIQEAKMIVRKILERRKNLEDWQEIKNEIEKELQLFFFKETQREPMILAVIININFPKI